ncbi:Actin [Trichuris suis]|nr:Actin [Trichuris suis]
MIPLIIEVGHSGLRAGYGGEVVPEFEMPVYIGAVHHDPLYAVGTDHLLPATPRYMAGREIVRTPREAMELVYLFDENEDSECWNEKQREKLVELMFEEYCVPYFMIFNTAVLSCYANAVTTCGIVIDSGAAFTCVSCVKDAVTRTTAAGNMLDKLCNRLLREKNIPVVEPYRIEKTRHVAPGKPPVFSVPQCLPNVTDSYRRYMRQEVVGDFKKRVVEVSTEPMAEMSKDEVEEIQYKFPAGNAHNFGIERYRIAEALFDQNSRKEFLKNVVVTGGTSMLRGFVERVKFSFTHYLRGPAKLEVHAVSREVRRHSPFIGASFYTNVAKVESTWMSRQDYKEHGAYNVLDKCDLSWQSLNLTAPASGNAQVLRSMALLKEAPVFNDFELAEKERGEEKLLPVDATRSISTYMDGSSGIGELDVRTVLTMLSNELHLSEVFLWKNKMFSFLSLSVIACASFSLTRMNLLLPYPDEMESNIEGGLEVVVSAFILLCTLSLRSLLLSDTSVLFKYAVISVLTAIAGYYIPLPWIFFHGYPNAKNKEDIFYTYRH